MRVAIAAACVRDKQILLVKKREAWILPGGKPKPGESDIDCLLREISEELPDVQARVGSFFRTIEGRTPHQGDILQCKVYFAEIEGEISPAAEINEARWIANPLDLNLPDITRKLILKLQIEGYL